MIDSNAIGRTCMEYRSMLPTCFSSARGLRKSFSTFNNPSHRSCAPWLKILYEREGVFFDTLWEVVFRLLLPYASEAAR